MVSICVNSCAVDAFPVSVAKVWAIFWVLIFMRVCFEGRERWSCRFGGWEMGIWGAEVVVVFGRLGVC